MKMSYSEAKRSILFWKGVSRFISVAFHPLLLPTILFMLLANNAPLALGELPGNVSSFLLLIFIFTFVFPLALFIIFILIVYGKISTDKILLDSRQDRVLPFLFIGVFYCGITYLLYDRLNMPGMVVLLLGCMSMCVLLVGMVSLIWKVSAHAAGITGVIGFLIALQKLFPDLELLNPVVGMIIVAGFVLSARLYLKAHTPGELLGGCIIGVVASALVYVPMII